MVPKGLAISVPPEVVAARKRARRTDLSDDEAYNIRRKPNRVEGITGASTKKSKQKKLKWLVAVDLDTTNTTVAWHKSDMPTDTLHAIDNMPGEQNLDRVGNQIITALWYPRTGAKPTFGVSPSEVRLRFGEEVRQLSTRPKSFPLRKIYDDSGRVTMMKLLLDESEYAQEAKDELKKTLELLKTSGIISDDYQVIFDIVREIFRAIQDRLRDVGFKDNSDGVFALFIYHSQQY